MPAIVPRRRDRYGRVTTSRHSRRWSREDAADQSAFKSVHRSAGPRAAGERVSSSTSRPEQHVLLLGHTSKGHTFLNPLNRRRAPGLRIARTHPTVSIDTRPRRARRGHSMDTSIPAPRGSPACGTLSRPASRAQSRRPPQWLRGHRSPPSRRCEADSERTARPHILAASFPCPRRLGGIEVRSAATMIPTRRPELAGRVGGGLSTISYRTRSVESRVRSCGAGGDPGSTHTGPADRLLSVHEIRARHLRRRGLRGIWHRRRTSRKG